MTFLLEDECQVNCNCQLSEEMRMRENRRIKSIKTQKKRVNRVSNWCHSLKETENWFTFASQWFFSCHEKTKDQKSHNCLSSLVLQQHDIMCSFSLSLKEETLKTIRVMILFAEVALNDKHLLLCLSVWRAGAWQRRRWRRGIGQSCWVMCLWWEGRDTGQGCPG